MDVFKWAVDLLADLIYGSFTLIFQGLDYVLLNWKQIDSPVVKLGSLMFVIMLLIILYQQYLLKLCRRNIRVLDLVCPTCQSNAHPLRGTVNRYRCVRGHQFNGDYHRR